MTYCEKHCPECREAERRDWMRGEYERIKESPRPRHERRFAWRPIRDPKSRRVFWLCRVVLHFSTRPSMGMIAIWRHHEYLEAVTREVRA